MTKRKRGIFTVAEAVTHWFEASEPAELVREENTADWIDQNSAVAAQSYMAPSSSTWFDSRAVVDIRTKALPEGLGPVSTHEPADQLVVNPTGTSQLVDRLDGRHQS